MTLDEAILHAYEKSHGCGECAKEHAQLAEWLTELRELKNERKIGHAESDLFEWMVCSNCHCWIPLGLISENIKYASEWQYCPRCGAKVEVN